MMDIGEIKGSISIEDGIMVLTLSEQERMKLIRRLAVAGEAYVDEKGYMDVHFDLCGDSSNSSEDGEDTSYSREDVFSGVVEELKEDKIDNEKDNPIDELLEEITGNKPKPDVVTFTNLIDDEEVDYDNVVDIEEHTAKRSIDMLTTEEKEFLVDLYINDFPTKAIMDSENVTKSALYSSLERERIPRKGKLNTIIRRLEDGDSPIEISSEEDVDVSVINRIIDTLD